MEDLINRKGYLHVKPLAIIRAQEGCHQDGANLIKGKAKESTGEGTNGENAKGTFSRGIPKGVMATENT